MGGGAGLIFENLWYIKKSLEVIQHTVHFNRNRARSQRTVDRQFDESVNLHASSRTRDTLEIPRYFEFCYSPANLNGTIEVSGVALVGVGAISVFKKNFFLNFALTAAH